MPRRGTLPLVNELIHIFKRSRLTYQELADRAGVTKSYISKFKTGAHIRISLPHFIWIAEALGYDVVLVKRPTKASYAGKEPGQNG